MDGQDLENLDPIGNMDSDEATENEREQTINYIFRNLDPVPIMHSNSTDEIDQNNIKCGNDN